MVLVLLVGALLATGVYWYYRAAKDRAAGTAGPDTNQPPVMLSESTKAVIGRADPPVEIRFYSLLDPATVPAPMTAFADRVDQLLGEYEREGGGKIVLSRFNSRSDADATAAAHDGLKAFNRDKGDACYFGIVVSRGEQKELLTQLSPEWEPAIESDLSRAIARVIDTKPEVRPPLTGTAPATPAAAEEVKRSIPNVESVSLEEGKQLLRDAALKDFKEAAAQMEVQVKEAQRQLTEAQNGKSEAAQQAAMKNLQQVQAEQGEKLKQIAARLQSQLAALEQLKK